MVPEYLLGAKEKFEEKTKRKNKWMDRLKSYRLLVWDWDGI